MDQKEIQAVKISEIVGKVAPHTHKWTHLEWEAIEWLPHVDDKRKRKVTITKLLRVICLEDECYERRVMDSLIPLSAGQRALRGK